jgi:CheY-like chemotaxis protein
MKSLSACRDIPVIVITGLTRGDRDAETIIRSFLETDHLPQPDAYLEKPFDNKQLVELASSLTKA